MKYLIFLIVALVVFWGLRKWRRDHAPAQKPDSARSAERMVRCETCSINVPQSESVCVQGHFFCSQAHAQARASGNERG